ncbi:MAG: twin-arginine translocase TatA/TatE family subunit [Bacteroidales bacterium]|jgi:sec-independent protein translocase protein TatA|nr:twin-arginine translocase TatA/TatE family subunit [Bacteroidales bacterium]HPB01818.1 twin-arginine translocase TatA/TatE family subunit [Bacteroidales bacterium]HPF00592.1 twin-arginine translocase TatA/TatE family subunit [Bacteroidales bacterium]
MNIIVNEMGMLGTTEIIVIVLVVLLLFGGKKIPELMRGLGRGVREFKDASRGVNEDEPKKQD